MPSSRSRPGPIPAEPAGGPLTPGLAAPGRARQTGPVLGAIIIVVVLVVAIPVAVFMTGAVVGGILGFFLTTDAEAEYEGTEYVGLA